MVQQRCEVTESSIIENVSNKASQDSCCEELPTDIVPEVTLIESLAALDTELHFEE